MMYGERNTLGWDRAQYVRPEEVLERDGGDMTMGLQLQCMFGAYECDM